MMHVIHIIMTAIQGTETFRTCAEFYSDNEYSINHLSLATDYRVAIQTHNQTSLGHKYTCMYSTDIIWSRLVHIVLCGEQIDACIASRF